MKLLTEIKGRHVTGSRALMPHLFAGHRYAAYGFRGMLVLIFTILCSSINAQVPTEFTLKECIEFGLKNHITINVFTNDVSIAKLKAKEAFSAYLPQAKVSLSFDDNLKLETTLIPAGQFGPEPVELTLGNPFAFNVTGRVDQTIFDPSLIAGLKANKTNIEIAELQKQQNEESLIVNISKAYYQILTLKEQAKLLVQNEKRYSEILHTLQLQYQQGVIKKVEYDRMTVNLNNTAAQKKYTQTNILYATNRLKYAMGLAPNNALVLKDSIPEEGNVFIPTHETSNVNNRLDYRIQQKNRMLQEIDLKVNRSAAYPVLTAYAQYGLLGYGENVSMMLKSSQHFDFAAIGLKLHIPIFSGFKQSSLIRQSKLKLDNMTDNLKLSENEYVLEIENFNTQLISSRTTLEADKNNLGLAKDVFETTSLQYQNGTASLSELLNSDYAYKEAQSNYLTSLVNYLTARIDLEKSNGTLRQYTNTIR